ncbi:F0F1 ATP synthase subunit B [Thioalkalivibrio sp. XN279]|uniref:F0F1 ATP synthase subunit B n=1 Tax=Thioalkalivibrio sp. XN279 TaxID=2714953 RepID=UPI0014091210|nr:F0F1 ATP synthase subunit B [Thioalkalivibrio sp. XN279]
MGINLTLFGQMLTFLVFVWFTKKFVWPPVMQALEERRARIAEGLAAADRGQKALEAADAQVAERLREARQQATLIIEQAERRGAELVEEAKETAQATGERMLAQARAEIEQETNRARETLRGEVAAIALSGAKQLLEKEIDATAHRDLLDRLAGQL